MIRMPHSITPLQKKIPTPANLAGVGSTHVHKQIRRLSPAGTRISHLRLQLTAEAQVLSVHIPVKKRIRHRNAPALLKFSYSIPMKGRAVNEDLFGTLADTAMLFFNIYGFFARYKTIVLLSTILSPKHKMAPCMPSKNFDFHDYFCACSKNKEASSFMNIFCP
jgi:hypothetical protein